MSNALPKINVAIVGVGKIARDQHMPVIAASSQFELVACVSQQAAVDSVPVYRDAELYTPANKQLPIAARLHLSDADGVKIDVDFDWRQTGPQSWDIEIDTDQGALRLVIAAFAQGRHVAVDSFDD